MARKFIDLTNRHFGKLTVLELVGKDKHYNKLWKCQCECGNVVIVRQGHLMSGHTTSCGCNKIQLDDLTNQRFGLLQVLYRTDDYILESNGKHYVQWHCRCDCGNEVDVIANNLKSGSTVSCGCRRFEDLSGRQFGDLTVIKQVDDYINPSGRKLVRYQCKCSCGKYKNVLADVLRKGETTSCGCKINSKGEHVVMEFLYEHGYNFELHKSFDDCLNGDGNKLNFDFYVKSVNLLIECNGVQHYEPVEFFGGDARFERQKEHDAIKAEYAMSHGFSYLALDCRRDNLKNLKVELNSFFDKHSWDRNNNLH